MNIEAFNQESWAPALTGVATGLSTLSIIALVADFLFTVPSAKVAKAIEEGRTLWNQNGWGVWLGPVKRAAAMLEGHADSDFAKEVSQKLKTTGNPLSLSPADFLGIMAIGSMTGLGILGALGVLLVLASGLPFTSLLFLTLVGAVLGALIPWNSLSTSAAKRIRAVGRDLPYSMDLMLLVLEGGGTIQEAFQVVANENIGGVLAEELLIVQREISFGATLAEALDNFAKRIPSSDLVLIVQAINHGLSMGSPIAGIYREQAELLREKRSSYAEKYAETAGSKLAFPVTIIMLATFVLILGPAILSVQKL